MKKDVGSQIIGVQMLNATDGTAFSGTVTVVLSKDGAAQAASTGTGPTLLANGYYTYAPLQAETNYDHIAFTFTGTGAIPVTVQVYTWPSSGSGARTIEVTVTDGTNPLENAVVRYTEGVNTFSASTDALGECTFNLDDATYTVGITKSGYSYAGTTHVVSAAATPTYAMTAIVIPPPSDPDLITMVLKCVDEYGVAEAGIEVNVTILAVPTGSTGFAFDNTTATGTSDVDGMVYIDVLKSGTYLYNRAGGTSKVMVAPSTGASFSPASSIGP